MTPVSQSPRDALLAKAKDRSALFGIVGLGYVGLPLAVELAQRRLPRARLRHQPARGGRPERRPLPRARTCRPTRQLAGRREGQDAFSATTDCRGWPSRTRSRSACRRRSRSSRTRTSATSSRRPRRSSRRSGAASSSSSRAPRIRAPRARSCCPALESTGLKVGEDFFLAFSPERVDPGNPTYGTRNTPKVVGGITPDCPGWRWRSTSRPSTRWSRSPRPRRPSW